jgi:hypothetical protein
MDRPRRPAERDRRQKLRQTGKLLRLGSPPSPCALCGYYSATPGILRSFPVSELAGPLRQKVLQRHHADGRKVSGFVVWLCVWCHAEESDAQHDLPERLRHPRTRDDQLLALLASNARAFKRIGETFTSRGEWLEGQVAKMLAASDEARGQEGEDP